MKRKENPTQEERLKDYDDLFKDFLRKEDSVIGTLFDTTYPNFATATVLMRPHVAAAIVVAAEDDGKDVSAWVSDLIYDELVRRAKAKAAPELPVN